MRLSERERQVIRAKVAELFGPEARVRLFGSRVDDSARGGDIDLLVEVPKPVGNRPAAAARLAAELQLALGDQRIDVVLVDPGTPPAPVHEAARRHGVPL